MLFEKFFTGLLGLHGGQFVPLGFESVDDVADEPTLNSIGLDLPKEVENDDEETKGKLVST